MAGSLTELSATDDWGAKEGKRMRDKVEANAGRKKWSGVEKVKIGNSLQSDHWKRSIRIRAPSNVGQEPSPHLQNAPAPLYHPPPPRPLGASAPLAALHQTSGALSTPREICAFKIYGQDAPFEAVVLNRTSGEGVLRASSPVDCESQKEYTFIIQAYDCGAGPGGADWKKSHKAVVHIQVNDVNEFSPVFREPLYKASLTEGKIYDSILQVEAWDQDCSPQYSQICNYEIVTAGTPFAIDRNGNIRNTERLSFEKQQSYQITVTAFDCGQKRAKKDVAVHIDVKPVCKPGWQGWNKRVDYEPGTGSRPLFPKMRLETCEGPLSGVKVLVELQTSHIGKGCDRETYSEKSLQKLCGAASGSTDLLPAPSPSANWTASLLSDSGRDSDLIYRFAGRQAANVPDHVVPQNLTDQFTVATWMKHGPSPGLRAEKETILCNSDKTEMNRHHYSLYVHNCRLVFLLRRDFIQVDAFRPAEFHWKLEQTPANSLQQSGVPSWGLLVPA
ncbi:Calsyntenin-2 Alcadein-gamma [Takifugu flavidus]|uniref:Calsyntenin-2 Alcadein-gamma n=1 Tax=Takifugu flavidus TaxID=433684 RepID=A0A5C6P1C0_9TELE|nr:Calsyntenin-2 Alcadein-gamma [Takifugu flavidus]